MSGCLEQRDDISLTVVIDLAIAIHIRLANHFLHLGLGQFLAYTLALSTRRRNRPSSEKKSALTQVGHHVSQLCRADEPVAVLVKHLEGFLDFFFAVRIAHLARHHGQELGKVDRAVSVRIHFVDHVLQLGFCRVLSQRAHHRAKLPGGDRAITVCDQQGLSDFYTMGGCRYIVLTFVEQRKGFLEFCAHAMSCEHTSVHG